MKRVELIVTGECEALGLGDAVERYFRAQGVDVMIRARQSRLDSFTSVPLAGAIEALAEMSEELVRSLNLFKLVATARAAIKDGANHVVIFDDVELANRVEPDPIVRYVHAFLQRLAGIETSHFLATLRQKCSLHLACPMIESWFFANSLRALPAIDVSPQHDRRRAGDAERFFVEQSVDPAYFLAPNAPKQERRRGRAPGWATDDRAEHPKHYLDYLCTNAIARSTRSSPGYSETRDGVAALRAIALGEALGAPNEMRYLRGFIADLADALGCDAPLGDTAMWPAPREAVLRNC